MTKLIKLTQEKFTLVDDEDFEELNKYKWYYGNEGYARRSTWNNGIRGVILLHRQLLNILTAEINVDHINGNRLDNRKENLRTVDKKKNSQNRHKKVDGTTSKYFGVRLYTNINNNPRWSAQITIDGKLTHLGYFSTEKEAAIVYNKKSEELGFLTRNIIE